MFKKILCVILVCLHSLTQSAGAMEFQPIIQPIPVQSLQVVSEVLIDKTTGRDQKGFIFLKISDSFRNQIPLPVAFLEKRFVTGITNGNATNYAYDNFDRLTTETFPDTRTNVYTYDKNSNVLTRTNPATQQIQYTYDALNRLTNQNYPSNTAMNISYGYDVGSLLTSAANTYSTNAFTYDNLNRVLTNTQTLNNSNYTVSYAYNDLNQTGITYPSAKNVTYAYNANNLLSTLSVGGTALMNLTYDTLSRRAQKDLTGTTTKQAIYTYDIADQLTTLENKIQGGATISKHDYTYDNVSNRLTHAITAAVNKNYTYTYNNIYELTGVSGSETSSFAYDKLGNRTTANSIPYTSNSLNQYTAVNSVTHNYDNNGNLTGDGTNTYGYDVESRLISFSKSGTTAAYTYDAFNRRVSITVNGTTIYYVYDGDDIIEERNSAGALNADWVHGDQIDEPLTMTRGGTTYYYFTDALGSVRELTNSAGTVQETYTYNSYGQLAAAPTINNPFTFTGREYDSESGNFYFRARNYDPSLGRFLQRDPLGYYDSMNLQQFVYNSPNNYVDPYGLGVTLDPRDIIISGIPNNARSTNSGNSGGGLNLPINIDPKSLVPPIGSRSGGFMPGEIGPRYPCMNVLGDERDNGDLRSNNGGETKDTQTGREKHNELKDKVKEKGEGWQSEKTIKDKNGKNLRPDVITPSGRPIELKPNTPSGRAAGQRQLRIYENALGKRGRVIYYNK